MSKGEHLLRYIAKSGFVRSVFLRVLSIFIIVSIAIAGVAFFSFASEMRKNTLATRFEQLSTVEDSISKRMDEITSIAYNLSIDPTFYIEPVEGAGSSSIEMSNTLERYLVGNGYIEHLAYYRLSEPDKIYISSGERSLSEFFMTSFGLDEATANEYIRLIQSCKKTKMITTSYGIDSKSYFAYIYPLPQLSENPRAFVMMLIPVKEAKPLFESLMMNSVGEVAVFDSDGETVFDLSTLGEAVPLSGALQSSSTEMEYTSESGEKYIIQKVVSSTNGWSYISVIRNSDTLSGLANKQIVLVLLMLFLVFIAIIVMLACIVVQYKPISNLAETVAEKSAEGAKGERIDERVVLSNTIATLTDDSEQKQRYETAFYEAEAASKAKSAFLSNMSHDIRTPMNAIIGMTAIALRHADDADYVRECLGKVQISSQYLLDIINNVLDMSRIESGRISLTEDVIDLTALADSIVSLIEPSVQAKKQKLTVDFGKLSDKMIIGDNVRLTQVFVNILSNSVKFTPEGGTITVDMVQNTSDDKAYGDYIFKFTDNGVGMSPEFVEKVFDTFSRARDADSSRVEGTGLGMAITRNLVELMGGSIVCESVLGKGSEFTVNLRLRLAATDNASEFLDNSNSLITDESDGSVVKLTGKRILLVEDNLINVEIAHRIIAETEAEVTEALNGKEAVKAFLSHPEGYFDLILMDLQMPVMNGYEATAEIRSANRADAKTIPIYAMTANTFDEDVRQVRDSGMDGHIGKPYTPEMLYRVLSQALC